MASTTIKEDKLEKQSLSDSTEKLCQIDQEIRTLWKEDRFPLFGFEYKFTSVLKCYVGTLVAMCVGIWVFVAPSEQAQIRMIKAEMTKIYNIKSTNIRREPTNI